MYIFRDLLIFVYIFFVISFFFTGVAVSEVGISGNGGKSGGRITGGDNVSIVSTGGGSTGYGQNGNNVVGEAGARQPSDRYKKREEVGSGGNGPLMGNSGKYINIATVEREGFETRSNDKEFEGQADVDRQNTNDDSFEVASDVDTAEESVESASDPQERESDIVEQEYYDVKEGEVNAEQEGQEEHGEDEQEDAVVEDEETGSDYLVTEEEDTTEVEKTEENQAESTVEGNDTDKPTNNAYENSTAQTENTTKDSQKDKETFDNDNGNKGALNGFHIKTQHIWNRINVFRIFQKPISDATAVNYFRNEMQNEFTFRNGLYFSCTSAYLYKKYVDPTKYAYMMLPDTTMILVVTANKLFFQDLIYSSNKYLSIKNKFAYLINTIIDNMKGKKFFRNYNYQYLFRSDPFAFDATKKLLDYDLLGELSGATQTIYADIYGGKKVSMHKIYGGWFQFLGIVAVNGYYYKEVVRPEPIEVVPVNMIPDFIKLVNMNTTQNYDYSNALGLWRDFPTDKFVSWRYSLELLLWDSLNILPNQLPHPAKFVLAYVRSAGKIENRKGQLENEFGNNVKDVVAHKQRHYTVEELRNWPDLVKKIVSEQTGVDVAIVAADDYNKHMNTDRTESRNNVVETGKNKVRTAGYILLLLLNAEFFNDKSLHKGSFYQAAKRNNFFRKLVAIIDALQEILKKIKDAVEPHVEPDVKVYNFLDKNEENYKVFNPHVLGSIAGITQHLKCGNAKYYSCTRDVSMHYKYGGWFEFGGVIFVKNIIPVTLNYEKHEIVKKNYEHSILLQANGNYQTAGLWRDIPEKDTSAYRYSLETFVLENPRLNSINIQKAHPFMIIDLINKGLRMVQHNTVSGNSEDNENENVEDEYKESGEVTATKKNLEDTIETKEEATEVERKMKEMENDPSLKSDGFNLNFGEKVSDANTLEESAQYGDALEGEGDVVDCESNGETDAECGEFATSGDDYVDDCERDSDLCNDGEMTESDEETNETQKLKGAVKPIEFFADSLKDAIDVTASEMGDGGGLRDIEHVYDHSVNGNDLNLLEADEEESSSNVQRNVILALLVVCLTLAVTCAVFAAFKLYERFTNRKVADKNELVLAFKDKDEIPIVHGMPAPWLKA